MRLTGKVVLVTNVGQYMGPACAEEFAKEGAILALHERTEARAQGALARAHGREATVVTGDLTVSGEANRVVRSVAERHGRLDVLVNNSSPRPSADPSTRSPTRRGGRWPHASTTSPSTACARRSAS